MKYTTPGMMPGGCMSLIALPLFHLEDCLEALPHTVEEMRPGLWSRGQRPANGRGRPVAALGAVGVQNRIGDVTDRCASLDRAHERSVLGFPHDRVDGDVRDLEIRRRLRTRSGVTQELPQHRVIRGIGPH